MSKGRHAYVKRGKLNRHRWTPRKLLNWVRAELEWQCKQPWQNNFVVRSGEKPGSIEVLWDPPLQVFTFTVPDQKEKTDEAIPDHKP